MYYQQILGGNGNDLNNTNENLVLNYCYLTLTFLMALLQKLLKFDVIHQHMNIVANIHDA